jgi:intergrase/recombinase
VAQQLPKVNFYSFELFMNVLAVGLRRGVRGPLHQREINGYGLYIDDSAYYCASLTQQRLFLPSFSEKLFDTVMQRFDVAAFEGWLLAHGLSRKHVRTMVRYVERHLDCFLSGRLSEVSAVAGRKHIMMAFSWLSKYLGVYDEWLTLRKKAGLKWHESRNVDVFAKVFLNETAGIEDWIRRVVDEGDEVLKTVVYFLTVTGLRVDEAIWSLNRIRESGLEGYYDANLGCLVHVRFREFLRGSKAAFITVVTERMMSVLSSWQKCGCRLSYPMIVKRLRKRGLPLKLHMLRKFYATKLLENGVSEPMTNIVQGRADGRNILVAHYWRPQLKTELEKIRKVIEEKIEHELFLVEKGVTRN